MVVDDSSKEITMKLANFMVETKYPQIPEEVVEFAKLLALKTASGMVAGSTLPSARKLANLIRGRRLPEDVGVIGSGFKTSLWEAVFLNAFLAHSSELEDDAFFGGTSWDITVIPLLFSLAEQLRLSGKALTEALVLGLEVHARTCMFRSQQLGASLISGAAGPAAAAARALGLGVQETAYALGLATSGVPLATINQGTDAHYFESALQSLQGIMAAEMAREGLNSNPTMPTYLTGLLGKDQVTPEKMVENLGSEWLFLNTWIKKYPCCFANHRAIDLVIELRKKHNLSYDQIEELEIHTHPRHWPLDRPEPKTVGDLQFSFQHTLGTAMLDGDVNLTHFSSDIIADPRYKEARSKVKVFIHQELSPILMKEPQRVIIKTKDGKEFSGERQYAIGSPYEPLTSEQIRALYSKFTHSFLGEQQIEQTAQAILNLEKLNDVRELMEILTFGSAIRK
ncbi:MmgE/PrpD family protein [Chloroflexota bacterium]